MTPIRSSRVARYLTGTVILSTIIAAAITAFGNRHTSFGENFLYSQCIGTLTYISIDLPRRLIWPSGLPPLLPMFGLAVTAAPIGWFGGTFIASILLGDPWRPSYLGVNAVLGFLALTAGSGIGACFFFLTRERLAESERVAVEARLKLLQAQIEPHFLFNTLANLQALISVDPPRAQEMLRHLDSYLRATLATTRKDWYTLAEEFTLIESYLGILAIRMGPRLAFELDLPQALAEVRLPPMLLQPLVENAIRHGLEPKVEGGSVRISAHEEKKQIVLVVEDTGRGFGNGDSAGTGIGLAHVKERLDAMYGPAASVQTSDNPGGGVSVKLRLPLQK